MKRLIPLLLLAGLAFAAGAFVAGRQQAARHTRELADERASWEGERARLEAALAKARARRTTAAPAPVAVEPAAAVAPSAPAGAAPDPKALLDELAGWQIPQGKGRAMRQVLARLDQLAQIGPPALPAIRQFLAAGRDVAYDGSGGKGARDIKTLTEALAPPSLRFGLFDVLRQIGGPEAETILLETLRHTGRAVEIAYLADVLDEMAPGKYRDASLAIARSLLSGGVTDRLEREYLFGVLRRFNDASFVSVAQAQLVQADGQVDRGALRYLQQTLGEQSVAVAAQAYRDGRLAEPGSKEPLARLALAYVGANPQAVQLWHEAILDPSLSPGQRRNLIEDLNDDGILNRKTPTPEDLKLIANRFALTQAYLQQDYVLNDKLLNAAFLEANKDLANYLERAASAPVVKVK